MMPSILLGQSSQGYVSCRPVLNTEASMHDIDKFGGQVLRVPLNPESFSNPNLSHLGLCEFWITYTWQLDTAITTLGRCAGLKKVSTD